MAPLLRSLLAARDSVEDGWVRLRETCWQRDATLVMQFSIHVGRRGRVASSWEVRARGVREYSLTDADGGGFAKYGAHHPVVRQYADKPTSLVLGRAAEDVDVLLASLWQAHWDEVDDWIPLDRYLPAPSALRDRLAKRGALCRGPRFLLKRYAACLRLAGARPILHSQVRPMAPRNPLRAIHFGNSFVVAGTIVAVEKRTQK